MKQLFALVILLGALIGLIPAAEAVTRYVDGTLSVTCTGSTYSIASRNCAGTDGTGYKTIPEGLRALVKSDVLNIRAGTYTVVGVYGNVASDTYGCQSGGCPTSWATATVIQNYPGEAVVMNTQGFNMDDTRSTGGVGYLIWQGDTRANFINQQGASDATGFRFADGAHHVRVTTMTLRNFTNAGCLTSGGTINSAFIEVLNNYITNCGDTTNQDHGIYPSHATSWLVDRNYFFANQGYGIHFNGGATPGSQLNNTITNNIVEGRKAGATASADCIVQIGGSGHTIANNVCIGLGGASVKYNGGIQLWAAHPQSGTKIYNNTIYDVTSWGIDINSSGVSGTIVRNNILSSTPTPILDLGTNTIKDHNHCTIDVPGCTLPGAVGFVSAGTGDLSLLSTSTALACGTNVGLPFNGATPPCGAFNPVTYLSATINSNSLDVTLGMNLNIPVLPATGQATWAVNNGRTVLSAAKLTGTDSVVRLTISGAECIGGETWTVTYTPGNVTDSALIGGTGGRNQKVFGFSAQAVTNACGSAPPVDPSTPRIYYNLDENTGTTATNSGSSGVGENGTLTNGPTWVTGKHGFAVQIADASDDYIAVPYGSGVNPSTQSLTVCGGFNPTSPTETLDRLHFGAPIGTNQRFYVGRTNATWGMGIQSSFIASNTEFPVSAGWTYLCVVADSATDTATLYVNGVPGTSAQSVKTYTSYTLAGNFELGDVPAIPDAGVPGGTHDEFKIYLTALSAADILTLYQAWEPPAPPSTCTLAQPADQWYLLRQNASHTLDAYGAQSATVKIVKGGSIVLVTQVNCTVAGGTIGQKLRYNLDGGAFLEVPDVMGPDGVAFYGTGAVTDPDILKTAVTCCLIAGLTAIDGATQWTADATPVTVFTAGSSTVQRRILRIDPAITATTVCFKEYDQTGIAFGTYTPSAGACLTVIPPQTGIGF